MSQELRLYFPKIFTEEDDYQFYQNLKRKLVIEANALLSDDEMSDEALQALETIKRYFVELNRPQNFRPNDSTNVIVQLDRDFGALCAMIDKGGSYNSNELTVFDFYSRIDFLSRQTSPKKVA